MVPFVTLDYFQVKEGYRKFVRQGRCLGHTSPVLRLDWTTDSQHIQSNSGEHEVMVWSAAVARPLRDIDLIRDLDWATADCTVQWASLGTWGETADSPDPSTAAVSRTKEVVGVGDTWGRVRLFSWPAGQPKSLSHTYTGHSSQVSAICWTQDGNKLLSVGGRDTAVLQWSLQ